MTNFNIKMVNYDQFIKEFSHSDQEGKAGMVRVTYATGQTEVVQAKVFIDRNFQRLFCWNRARRRAFLRAILKKRSGAPITIACIESCITHSELVGDQYSTAKLKELLSWGYKYISLDGQNRALTAQEFAKEGSLLAITNATHVCTATKTNQDLENKLLKDFPPSVKADFLTGTKIPVNIYTGYTYSELAQEFRDLNSSEQLNPMEWRNSYQSYISKWIRQQTRSHKDVFEKFTTKKTIQDFLLRMHDRSLYSVFCLYLGGVFKSNTESFKKPFEADKSKIKKQEVLDLLFECGDSTELTHTRFPYCMKKLDRVDKIVSMLNTGSANMKKLNQGKSIYSWQLWAFLAVYEWVYDNGYNVKNQDQEEFTHLVNTFLMQARRNSKTQHAADESRLPPTHPTGDLPKQGYFWGQLETIGDPLSRRGLKKTIDSIMNNNINNLPVFRPTKSPNIVRVNPVTTGAAVPAPAP